MLWYIHSKVRHREPLSVFQGRRWYDWLYTDNFVSGQRCSFSLVKPGFVFAGMEFPIRFCLLVRFCSARPLIYVGGIFRCIWTNTHDFLSNKHDLVCFQTLGVKFRLILRGFLIDSSCTKWHKLEIYKVSCGNIVVKPIFLFWCCLHSLYICCNLA